MRYGKSCLILRPKSLLYIRSAARRSAILSLCPVTSRAWGTLIRGFEIASVEGLSGLLVSGRPDLSHREAAARRTPRDPDHRPWARRSLPCKSSAEEPPPRSQVIRTHGRARGPHLQAPPPRASASPLAELAGAAPAAGRLQPQAPCPSRPAGLKECTGVMPPTWRAPPCTMGRMPLPL